MTDLEKGRKLSAQELYDDFLDDPIWKCVGDMGQSVGAVDCIWEKMIDKYALTGDVNEKKRNELYDMVDEGVFQL
jgi:hypothetical protein